MIIYISENFGELFGSSQSALDVLIALIANNYSVAVCTKRRPELSFINGLDSKKKTEWILPVPKVLFPKDFGRDYFIKLYKWADKTIAMKYKQLCKYIILKKTNIVIVNSLGNHNYFCSLNLQARGKKILLVRESPGHFQGKLRLQNLDWAINAFSTYDNYIFVSSVCLDKWKQKGVIGKKKAFYVPNCCREDLVEKVVKNNRKHTRMKLGLPMDKFIMVCVASIQYRKGQDLLLEIFRKLCCAIPDIFLCIIGPPIGDWGKLISQKIEREYSGAEIKLFGKRHDALEFIYASDLIVLPSRAEALPRVILEAMALKTPVVASDVDGIPEIVENEKTGILFSKNNCQELFEAIKRMAMDQELRKRLSRCAYEKYWSGFSRKHQINRFREVIEKI